MKKYLTTLSIALIATLAFTWGISRLYATQQDLGGGSGGGGDEGGGTGY